MAVFQQPVNPMEQPGYILNLGVIEYWKAWDLQRQLWAKRVNGDLPDMLLLLEHPHVITLGRRGNRSHLLTSEETLARKGIPVFHVERGGDVTYHGPGQLIAYPILNLKDRGYHVVQYVEQLEEVIIRVLRDFGIAGERDPRNRGVWVAGEKIASLGVAIKRWVSFHGLALNYATDLSYFDLIDPCGLEGVRITSMQKILWREISKNQLCDAMASHFQEVMNKKFQQAQLWELLPDERPAETALAQDTSIPTP
jgi:lipoate-protein ligase B